MTRRFAARAPDTSVTHIGSNAVPGRRGCGLRHRLSSGSCETERGQHHRIPVSAHGVVVPMQLAMNGPSSLRDEGDQEARGRYGENGGSLIIRR